MSSVTNENLKRLRELSDELCASPNNDYKVVVKKLKTIIDEGKKEIETSKTSQTKIKCYETMCASITTILAGINI